MLRLLLLRYEIQIFNTKIMKYKLLLFIIIIFPIINSCKKAKDPISLTLRVESTCAFKLVYYLYYGSKYDPFYITQGSNWERSIKIYEGNRLLMKGEKDSNGTSSDPVVFKILNGEEVLAESSSSNDKEEIKIEYTYE